MPTFTITAPNGKTLSVQGDHVPTEGELDQIFKAAGIDPTAPAEAPSSLLSRVGSTAADLATGVAKGAAHTALDLGQAVDAIPGVTTAVDTLYGTPGLSKNAFAQARQDTAYTDTAQRVGGGAETLAELAAPVGEGVEAFPKVSRAAGKFQQVMAAAKDVPVDVEAPGQVALRIQQLADRGASMPQAVRKYLLRATDPTKDAPTYEEIRDFASNISRLSANETQRLTPVVGREVANLRVALNKAAGDAAAKVGQLENYQSAMKAYAQAMKVRDAIGAAWMGAKKSVPYIGAAGAGEWLSKQIRDLLSSP